MTTVLRVGMPVAITAYALGVATARFVSFPSVDRADFIPLVPLIVMLALSGAVLALVHRRMGGADGRSFDDPRARAKHAGILLFTSAVTLQAFHQIEHIVQVVQAKVFHITPAHALLGSIFDTEWVHVGYNGTLFMALAVTWVACGHDWRECWRAAHPAAFRIFSAGLILQGYHVVEHLAKVTQHVELGLHPAPGILGFYVDLVWLHFTINLVVLTTMLVAFVELRLHPAQRPRLEPAVA